MALTDWLPNFKETLNNFYEEKLKGAIETKSTEAKAFFNTKSQEYQELLNANFAYSRNTQKALVAVAVGIFLLLLIAYFWKD
jgi:hypothetical protein